MNIFRTLVSTAVLSLAIGGHALATDYREALKVCGAEWKASEARKAVAKGEGAKAWQDFRAKCVREKGWDGKKAPTKATA